MQQQPQVSMAAYALSSSGKRRATNEDAWLMTDFTQSRYNSARLNLDRLGERGTLLAVADGIGDTESGEVASAMAVTMLRYGLQQVALQGAHSEQLRRVTEYANTCIWRYARRHPQLKGMGTTLTAALVRGDVAYLAQVGDSRAYLFRAGAIQQLTQDQTLGQKLLDECWLFPEEITPHPNHSLFLPLLGANPEVEVTLRMIALKRQDYLLLCSDGLSNNLTSMELRQIVQPAKSPAAACQQLIELASQRGGEDNISVIVAQFAGTGLGEAQAEAMAHCPYQMAQAA